MNIWILHQYAGPPGSGRMERAAHVARELTALGHACTVFHAAFHHLLLEPRELDDVAVESHDGATYVAIPGRTYRGNSIGRLRAMFEFPRRVLAEAEELAERSGKPDFVIVSSPPPTQFKIARRLRKRYGTRVVFEVRDLWPESLTELAGASGWHPFVRFIRRIVRRAYRESDGIIVTAPGVDEYVAGSGWTDAPVLAITNGVEPSQFEGAVDTDLPPAHRELLDELEARGKTTVVYAGSMGPPNALDQLLAMEIDGDPPFHLVLVGAGVSREQLETSVDQQQLSWVTILEPVARRQVPALLSRAQATIIAWRDSPLYRLGVSPNKIGEYFLAGKPVIWIGNTGNDPVVDSGAGRSLPPNDPDALKAALLELAGMPDGERERLGELGRRYALDHLDWRQLGAEYERFLTGLVEPPST